MGQHKKQISLGNGNLPRLRGLNDKKHHHHNLTDISPASNQRALPFEGAPARFWNLQGVWGAPPKGSTPNLFAPDLRTGE